MVKERDGLIDPDVNGRTIKDRCWRSLVDRYECTNQYSVFI